MLGLITFVLYALVAQLISRNSITRQSLGITSEDLKQQACNARWRVPIYQAGEFDREKGSYEYLQYAVAAADVYGERRVGVTLANYGGGWENLEKRHREITEGFLLPSRLTIDYYFKDEPDHLTVLVAFRGTDLLRDWSSNASWLTRPTPLLFDHYADARKAFEEVRGKAVEYAGGKPIHYIVTGHSLGGGLAMHIAYGYPCVSAVVFNASPVINKHLYQEPFEETHIALLYQHCEILGVLRQLVGGQETKKGSLVEKIQSLFGGERISRNFHDYDYDLYNDPKVRDSEKTCLERWRDERHYHNMDNYVMGVARFAIDCEFEVATRRRQMCDFPEFLPARRVYCPYFGSAKFSKADDELCRCNDWPKDRDRLREAKACF